ncbi:MAG: N-acetylneuraminate synthase family protein [Promethearchaeota archaeon]
MVKVIAEFCQNHNGKWDILKEMIWKAAEAGADYAKVQSMLADEIAFRERFEQGIIKDGKVEVIKRPYHLEYDRLKPMDLTDELFQKFVDECNSAGIEPQTTVFTRQRIPFLATLRMNSVKVASYDCGSYPLIRELKEKFNYLYVSTGATFDEEIEKTAQILKNHEFSFLHCVTIYPTPLEFLNLNRMNFLRRFTSNVGFSDHSLTARDGINASIIALAFGADVIERHFTVLKPEESRDGPVSINPQQLKELVNFSNQKPEEIKDYVKKNFPNWEIVLGKEKRELTHEELLNRDYYRGRFVSKINGKIIYNWEDKKVF